MRLPGACGTWKIHPSWRTIFDDDFAAFSAYHRSPEVRKIVERKSLSFLHRPHDGLDREFIEIKWLDGGRVQILCTQVLLFFPFRSHEIARHDRRMTPIAGVALCC